MLFPHKAVDYGTGLRSGHGIDHHPVLPADGEPPDSSFSPVVVDRHFTIREEYPEIRLLVDTIPDPITRSVAHIDRFIFVSLVDPRKEGVNERAYLFVPPDLTFLWIQFFELLISVADSCDHLKGIC